MFFFLTAIDSRKIHATSQKGKSRFHTRVRNKLSLRKNTTLCFKLFVILVLKTTLLKWLTCHDFGCVHCRSPKDLQTKLKNWEICHRIAFEGSDFNICLSIHRCPVSPEFSLDEFHMCPGAFWGQHVSPYEKKLKGEANQYFYDTPN